MEFRGENVECKWLSKGAKETFQKEKTAKKPKPLDGLSYFSSS